MPSPSLKSAQVPSDIYYVEDADGRPSAPEFSNAFFQNISRRRRSGTGLLGKAKLAINLGKTKPSGRLGYTMTFFRISTYSVTSD
jgi:hypothetical protein